MPQSGQAEKGAVMKRTPLSEIISLAAKAAAPATAVATSLAASLAQAASGDLDPAFADHGRLAQILGAEGAVYSLEALQEGGALIGGGDVDRHGYYCWYYCDYEASSFSRRVTDDGAIDPAYEALAIAGIEAYGFARQADGKVVAAGRRVSRRTLTGSELVVFRLAADGSLDDHFGQDGFFDWSPGGDVPQHDARSLVLDSEGRIVVAGTQYKSIGGHYENRLVVLRLLQDGSLDSAFGEAGVVTGPAVNSGYAVQIGRTSLDHLRIAAPLADGCGIVGLDANGALDTDFGSAGVASVQSASGDPVTCNTLEVLPDGKLLVAGSAGDGGFAARLLPGGAPDSAFAADASVAGSMAEATAIRATSDGKVLVAGSGVDGASIMRLQATGQLDELFGDGGRTWIDLPSDDGSAPIVRDIAERADGGLLAAGGDQWSDRPFVVRLLGDAAGASAGVIGFTDNYDGPLEADGEAIVRVRRSGGSDGAVSVRYRTIADAEATAGADFTAASGTLTWADGDASEQEIAVAIAADSGPAESFESFHIALDRVEGGAGLALQRASVSIQPDGAPSGQLEIADAANFASEPGVEEIWVARNYYSQGEVSVKVSFEAITATADDDFVADPVTLTWGPDDIDWKVVRVEIKNDSEQEDTETFRAVLSDPAGGAVLGARSSHVVTIRANDQSHSSSRPHGGGGATGWLSLLLLGFAEALRRVPRRVRKCG
jgi:uncharacterized delta-60 repeat protein